MAFAEVEISLDEAQIAEEGIAKLKELLEAKGYVGWEANPADLSVIILQTVASMELSVAQIASVVPPAIFRKYGTELVKTPYNEGAAATVTANFKLLEENGKYAPHTIEAGTQLTIGELAFVVATNVAVLEGEKEKLVPLVAIERGSEYNNLTGTVVLVNAISWVSEVLIVGESSGGVDQESDEEYENRLAAALKLQAPRPITAANFAEMALDVPSTIVPTGVVVGRTTAIDGYHFEENTFEGKVVSASKEMVEVTNFKGITPKTELTGTGLAVPTTVESINEGAKTLQMVQAAISSPGKKESYKAIGSYENQRTVTTFVTDKQGKALTTEANEKIETWLREFRELNFLVYVRGPSTAGNEVRVTTQVHLLPGYVATAVEASVKTALEKYLSAETWGNPTAQETGASSWLNITQGFSLVRYNALIGVIEAVPGVQYVFAGSTGLAIGLEEAVGTKVADLTLRGPAPLPNTKAANIKVTSA